MPFTAAQLLTVLQEASHMPAMGQRFAALARHADRVIEILPAE